MSASNLPTLSLAEPAWSGDAPDPLAKPALYDGILAHRSMAYLVDLGILLALDLTIHVLLILLGVLSLGTLWLVMGPLIALVSFIPIAIAYDTLLIGGKSSATFGMRWFDVEARGWDGRRPDLWQALLNSALFYATITFTGLLILLVALFTPRHRAAHDYLSGIVMIRRGSLTST
ncbi:MAG: RDD family protein [Dongiaceae bacterium]